MDQFMGEMKKKYQNVIDDTKRKRVSRSFKEMLLPSGESVACT